MLVNFYGFRQIEITEFIYRYRKMYGYSIEDITKKLKYKNSNTYYNYEQGIKKITPTFLSKFFNLFKLDWFIGQNNEICIKYKEQGIYGCH